MATVEYIIKVTNVSTEMYSAISAEVEIEKQDDGHFFYELSGDDWGQSIGAGQSITVGFNAMQGELIGNNGALTSEDFFFNNPVI